MVNPLAWLNSPAPRYDPQREAQFGAMAAGGHGSPGADLVGAILGSIGGRRQRRARDMAMDAAQEQGTDALVSALSGFAGRDVSPQEATGIMSVPGGSEEFLKRTRPVEAPSQIPPEAIQHLAGVYGQEPSAVQAAIAAGIKPGTAMASHFAEPEVPEPPQRRIVKGADDFQYYADTGERVLPDVTKPVEAESAAELPKPPAGYRWADAAGTSLEAIEGGPATKLSEGQTKAFEAANRVGRAIETLETPTESGQRLFDLLSSPGQRTLGRVLPGSYGLSPDYQRAQNVMSDAVAALLRLETGAAATEFEQQELLKRYAPQPGDSPQVIEQKLQGLKQRLESAQTISGPAYAGGAPSAAPAGPVQFSPDNPFR